MILTATILAAVVAATTAVHLPVTTSDARAQSAVDRGLFLYYAYNGGAAADAFQQAATFDRHLAMAYWGIALADGPELNRPMTAERFARAAQAMRQAVTLSHGASPFERRLIAIMAARYRGSFADWRQEEAAYARAMLQFARDSQNDNARLLAAEALLETGGLAWQGDALADEGSRQALELVRRVLVDEPRNPMANHLCIHLYDLAPDRSPALPCAQRLDRGAFTPPAEHLVHMPAHFWMETGDYAAALASSDRAYGLLVSLQNETPGSEHARQYARHDVAVGYSAAMMLGNYAVASRWAQRMGEASDQSFDALTALRFGRYAVAETAAPADFGGQSVRGIALLQLGRTADARALAARVGAPDARHGYMAQIFLARLAEADGDTAAAVRWIARARDNQRSDFSGELIPLFPADEALGELYLRREDYAGAVAAFTAALAAYPNDPRALFGLTQALSAQGENARATAVRARFETQWKGADTNAADSLP